SEKAGSENYRRKGISADAGNLKCSSSRAQSRDSGKVTCTSYNGSLDCARDEGRGQRPRLQLRCALRRFLQPQRQCLVHAWLRDHRRTLTGRMKIRLDVECQFLVTADYSDRHRFSGSQKERCVDDVVRLMDFPVSNLE